MFEPQEIHPDLRNEYIDAIGQLLVEAHNEVIDRASEEHDNGWSIGCSSHQWRGSFMAKAAMAGDFPWFDAVDMSNRYIFSINGVHFSMYRGSADKPRSNILTRASEFPELRQLPLFAEEDMPPELVWSFALETGPGGEVVNLEFVGMTPSGTVIASRTVPLGSIYDSPVPLYDNEHEAVDLPPAEPRLPGNAKKEKSKASQNEDRLK